MNPPDVKGKIQAVLLPEMYKIGINVSMSSSSYIATLSELKISGHETTDKVNKI